MVINHAPPPTGLDDDAMKDAFIIVDADHSGGIDAVELVSFLSQNHEENFMHKESFFRSMFQLAELWVEAHEVFLLC